MEASNEDLVDRFRQGDLEAATELHRRHALWLLAMVRNMVVDDPARSAYDEEGFVNSGFRSFFSRVSKSDFNARQWEVVRLLTTIVKRKCLKALRRTQPPVSRAPEDLVTTTNLLVACNRDAQAMAEVAAELRFLIGESTASMTPKQRKIIAIVHDEFDLRSIDDIARACDCSLTYVEDTIKEFLAGLRRRLKDRE